MQFNAALVKLRAIATHVKLQTVTSSQTLSFDAQYVLLKAQALTGKFVEFVSLDELLQASDTKLMTLLKNFSEIAVAADAFDKSFGKAISDIGDAQDQAIKDLSKNLTELQTVAEEVSKSLEKGFADSAAAADAHTLDNTKPIFETVAASDDFQRIVDYVRSLTDSSFANELATLSVLKVLSEAPSVSEEATKSLARYLFDIVQPTDDLDGEATAEDDQVMAFTKTRSELLTASDNFSRTVGFSRIFTEEVTKSDEAVKSLVKSLAETTSSTDDIDVSFGKQLTETISAVEAAFKELLRGLTDAAATLDATVKAAEKNLTETVPIADSGTLVSQGYCDLTYFAEDYVGTRFNF